MLLKFFLKFFQLIKAVCYCTSISFGFWFDRILMVVSKTEHSKTKTEARRTQIENEAPKTRKRSTQISKTKHPKLETCLSFKNTRQSLVKSPAAGIKHENKWNAVQNYSSRTTSCCKCISVALTIGHFGVAQGTGASIRFKLSIN